MSTDAFRCTYSWTHTDIQIHIDTFRHMDTHTDTFMDTLRHKHSWTHTDMNTDTDTQVDTQAHSNGCKHRDVAHGHTYTHLHSHTHDTYNTLVDTDTFMNSHKHEHIYTVTLMDTLRHMDMILDTHLWTHSWIHKLVDKMFTQTCSRSHPGGHTPWWTWPHFSLALPASLSTCLWIAVGQTDRPFSRGAGDGLAGDFSRPSGSQGLFSSSFTGSAGEKNVECSFPNPPWVPVRTEASPSVCACCQREEGDGQSGRPPISMGHTGPELGMCSRGRGLEDLPQMMPVWTGACETAALLSWVYSLHACCEPSCSTLCSVTLQSRV